MREEGRFYFYFFVLSGGKPIVSSLFGLCCCQVVFIVSPMPLLANKNVQTEIVWVLQQRWVNLIKGCATVWIFFLSSTPFLLVW